MANQRLSQAIKEAYASAPSDQVILETLELRHPAFVDELGNPVAIRVVKDNTDLLARLEATAPLDAGQIVRFVAFNFDLTLPALDETGIPEIIISMDNVSRDITMNLELAVATTDLIEVTYRPYLSTDLDEPQMNPPMTLTLVEVKADPFKVEGIATFAHLTNKQFPAEVYTASRFPGLLR